MNTSRPNMLNTRKEMRREEKKGEQWVASHWQGRDEQTFDNRMVSALGDGQWAMGMERTRRGSKQNEGPTVSG